VALPENDPDQFLPQIIGQTMVDDILRRGRRYYRASYGGYMPVEFQTGTYRMGHSMVPAVVPGESDCLQARSLGYRCSQVSERASPPRSPPLTP
jgi:hypothetical protein